MDVTDNLARQAGTGYVAGVGKCRKARLGGRAGYGRQGGGVQGRAGQGRVW